MNGPVVRATSPKGGRSTLITSAPRSHKVIAAYGPESTHVKSKTLTSASGPGMQGPPSESTAACVRIIRAVLRRARHQTLVQTAHDCVYRCRSPNRIEGRRHE